MKENNECIEVVLQETYLDLAPAIASDYIKNNLNKRLKGTVSH